VASLAPSTRKTLEDLEAVLASAALPPRIARNCEYLVDRLRRPIRVGLIGFEAEQRKRLLAALLGTEVLPVRMAWPTMEIGFAERAHTRATLADASTLAADGMPIGDLLERGAVFLKVGAPLGALRRVTFLYLAAGEDAAEQSAALRWAARRMDFALWCTRDFSPLEARIWNEAARELKNHAYLVVFAPQPEVGGLRDRMPPDFERAIFLPGGPAAHGSGATDMQTGAQRLLGQLVADIDQAIAEDLDAAQLLLHRCGQGIVTAKPEPQRHPEPSPATASRPAPGQAEPPESTGIAGMVDLVSEPLIFLRRMSRDLFEAMEWHDADAADWAGEVLGRCCEITDGLRDHAADWPEDEGAACALRALVDDASDMATLLQIEGGPAQALDAAALLLQLRSAFEACLAGPGIPLN
jgi:hypothetical protein